MPLVDNLWNDYYLYITDRIMEKELHLSSNEDNVWLNEPDEVYKDMDVVLEATKLKNISKDSPVVNELIKKLDCNLIVDSNSEYWPFSNN